MMSEYTTLEDLVPKIMEVTKAYRENVLAAIADSLPDCDRVFLREVKELSPYNKLNTTKEHYRDCWKVKSMRKAKFVTYIGNTKTVMGREGEIPLINILEYSTKLNPEGGRGTKHVQAALNNSKDEVFDIIVKNIRKESSNAQPS